MFDCICFLLIILYIPSIISLKPIRNAFSCINRFFCWSNAYSWENIIKIDHQQYVEFLKVICSMQYIISIRNAFSVGESQPIGRWFKESSSCSLLLLFPTSLLHFIEKDNAQSACWTNPNRPHPFGFIQCFSNSICSWVSVGLCAVRETESTSQQSIKTQDDFQKNRRPFVFFRGHLCFFLFRFARSKCFFEVTFSLIGLTFHA